MRQALVVEDHQDVRALIELYLGMLDWSVFGLPDLPSALAWLEEQHEPPGLLVADLMLGRAQSIPFVRAALERWPELPVVLVSGMYERAIAELRAVGPRVVLLPKPFSFYALQGGVLRACELARADPSELRKSG